MLSQRIDLLHLHNRDQWDESIALLSGEAFQASSLESRLVELHRYVHPLAPSPPPLLALRKALSALQNEESDLLMNVNLPFLVREAGKAPILFPLGELPQFSATSSSTSTFSRREVLCLVALLFFSLVPQSENNKKLFCFANYLEVFGSKMDAAAAHIRALFDYVDLMRSLDSDADSDLLSKKPIKFEIRKSKLTEEMILLSSDALCDISVRPLGEIGDVEGISHLPFFS